MRAVGGGFGAFVVEALAPVGAVSLRRMFGTTGVFCRGVLMGVVDDDALYLRVDDGNRGMFAEVEPYRYRRLGRMIDLPFWAVPGEVLDSPEAMAVWGRAALGAAERVAAGRGRRRGRPPHPGPPPRGGRGR